MRIVPVLLAAVLGCGNARAELAVPKPFTATYRAEFRGIDAGRLIFALTRDPATGQYTYESRANPTMLARLIVSSNAQERSVMVIDDAGVRPQHWHVDDGKTGNKEDGDLSFDWAAQRVRGEIKGKPVDLATQTGLQDRISVQIAVITLLQRGGEPGTVPMVDSDHVKYYLYKKGGNEALTTQLGKLDTVIYESSRERSDRVSRFWLAPSLDYVPVRAEQIRKGKLETVMTIVELRR